MQACSTHHALATATANAASSIHRRQTPERARFDETCVLGTVRTDRTQTQHTRCSLLHGHVSCTVVIISVAIFVVAASSVVVVVVI